MSTIDYAPLQIEWIKHTLNERLLGSQYSSKLCESAVQKKLKSNLNLIESVKKLWRYVGMKRNSLDTRSTAQTQSNTQYNLQIAF